MLEKTGMPIRSRSVISATLVMPATAIFDSMRESVSSGGTALCVSFLYFLDDAYFYIRVSTNITIVKYIKVVIAA